MVEQYRHGSNTVELEIPGGNRKLVPVLARAAVACGCDGVFLETHPDPDRALSDGPNQVHVRDVPRLLEQLSQLRSLANEYAEPPTTL